MTNHHTQWRRALSNQIANQDWPSKASAMIVSGSTARNMCDEYSDLEIGVFWDAAPNDIERRIPRDLYRSDITYTATNFNDTSAPTVDVYDLCDSDNNHIKVDVIHWLLSDVHNVFQNVQHMYDICDHKIELISAIFDCIILRDNGDLLNLKSHSFHYPRELMIAMISEHLKFNPYFGPDMLSSRSDMFVENCTILNNYIERIVRIMYAINGVYYRGDLKWLEYTLSSLKIAPKDLYQKIHTLKTDAHNIDWNLFGSILVELKQIVNAEIPEVNTDPIDLWFERRRVPIQNFTILGRTVG